MAHCAQKLTWHLKKEQLERLLDQAGNGYSALEFKFCINPASETRYYMSLVKVNVDAPDCDGLVTHFGEEEACPVPPDCNEQPEMVRKIINDFYQLNKIGERTLL